MEALIVRRLKRRSQNSFLHYLLSAALLLYFQTCKISFPNEGFVIEFEHIEGFHLIWTEYCAEIRLKVVAFRRERRTKKWICLCQRQLNVGRWYLNMVKQVSWAKNRWKKFVFLGVWFQFEPFKVIQILSKTTSFVLIRHSFHVWLFWTWCWIKSVFQIELLLKACKDVFVVAFESCVSDRNSPKPQVLL
jgi:hypothetical protein